MRRTEKLAEKNSGSRHSRAEKCGGNNVSRAEQQCSEEMWLQTISVWSVENVMMVILGEKLWAAQWSSWKYSSLRAEQYGIV